jgi:hypothetical protein
VRMLEWIFVAISDIEIWDRNTRRRRRDDPVIAQWRRAQRRAGFSVLACVGAIVIAMAWMALGPAADKQLPGIATLVTWTDRIVAWFVLGTMALMAVRCYQAWRFEPSGFIEDDPR